MEDTPKDFNVTAEVPCHVGAEIPVIALFMQNWHDTTGTLHGDCPWKDDRMIAEMVAKKLEIPFHFVDLSEVYSQKVVDYMFSEYEKGRTPNPDVLCNREIKFDAFLKVAMELNVDYVATGHYCRKETIIDENEAKLKISNQMDIEEKRKLANLVIDNSKDLKHLQNEVERVIGEII